MDEYNRYFLDSNFAAQELKAQRSLPKVPDWKEMDPVNYVPGTDDYNRAFLDPGFAEQEARVQSKSLAETTAHERFRDFYRNSDKYVASYDDNFTYEGTRYNGASGSMADDVLLRPTSDSFKPSMESRYQKYEDSYGSIIDNVEDRYMTSGAKNERLNYLEVQRQLDMQRNYEININTEENRASAKAETESINKILAGDSIERDKVLKKNRYKALYDEGMTSDMYEQAVTYRELGHSDDVAKQLGKDAFIFKDITDGRERLDKLFNSGDAAVKKNMVYSYFENPDLMFKGNVSNQILDEVYKNANNVNWQKGYINSRLMSGDYEKSFGFKAGTKLSDINSAQRERLLNDFQETRVKNFNSLMETPEYTTVRGDERVLSDFKPKRRSVKDVITRKGKDIGDPDAGIGIIKTGSSYTAEGARVMHLDRQGGQKAMGVLDDAVKAYGSNSIQGRAASAYKSFLSDAYDTGKNSVDLGNASKFLREHGMTIKEADSIQKAMNKGIRAATNTNTSGISKAVRRMTKGKAAWIAGTALIGTWAASEIWDE